MELLENIEIYKWDIAVVAGVFLLIFILKKSSIGCYVGFHNWGITHCPSASHYNPYPSLHRKCSQCEAWESKEELSNYKWQTLNSGKRLFKKFPL